MKKRWVRITLIVLAVFAVLITLLSYLVDEPIRRYAERELNDRLKGYSVRIAKLTTHPLRLSVDLKNLVIIQKANPEPPIAAIAKVNAGLYWRDLFAGHVVADAEIDAPRLYINIKNLTREIRKPPEEKEAWQDAIQAIFPLEINEFRIRTGEAVYVEQEKFKPVTISGITFIARNVRNIKSRSGVYPSTVYLEAVLFSSGTLTAEGRADFMLKPFPAVVADLNVKGLDISQFREIAKPRQIAIEKGMLSLSGSVEFTPKKKIFMLNELLLNDPGIDYIYAAKPVSEEIQKAEKAKQAEKLKQLGEEVVDRPSLLIKAGRIRISGGEFGLVNTSAKPDYRVYMSNLDLEVTNFSNKFSEGPADLHLKGQFMGSGETAMSGTFRPEKKGPDFTIRIAIKDTQMPAMNNIFRAYGNFDVSAGLFSFYSEMTVKNNKVTGYVKPLFRDLRVYDKRTDEEKNAFRKLYEKIVGGIVDLFENRPREEVATETAISGTIGNPEASTWTVLVNLVRNAFFQAILPGFEENIP